MMTSERCAKILYRGLSVMFFDGGYFCRIPVDRIAIDADGAPNAYGPQRFEGDLDGCGIDTLKHCSYPTGEYNDIPDDWHDILVSGDDGEPFVKDDGFFISKTTLCDDAVDERVAGKYVDAGTVSYIVMPQFWIDHLGVGLGDLSLLWHSRLKRRTVAIIADTCPVDEPLGEMSIAAAANLGGLHASPLTGVELPANGTVHCHVFKGSRPELIWPLTDEFIQSFQAELEDRLPVRPA